MSCFSDFQTNWIERFPDCELPQQVWEEDVRTNLIKHRERVAFLKVEVEKEEFFVEYLEKLLADAQKKAKESITDNYSTGKTESEKSFISDSDCVKDKCLDTQIDEHMNLNSSIPKISENIEKKNLQNIHDIKPTSVSDNKTNTYSSQNSPTLDSHISECKGSENKELNSKFDSVIDVPMQKTSFVTVIEVGCDSSVQNVMPLKSTYQSRLAANSSGKVFKAVERLNSVPSMSLSSFYGQSDTDSQIKRKPPTPPPKKTRRPFSDLFAICQPSSEKTTQSSTNIGNATKAGSNIIQTEPNLIENLGENSENSFEKELHQRYPSSISTSLQKGNVDDSVIIPTAATFSTFRPSMSGISEKDYVINDSDLPLKEYSSGSSGICSKDSTCSNIQQMLDASDSNKNVVPTEKSSDNGKLKDSLKDEEEIYSEVIFDAVTLDKDFDPQQDDAISPPVTPMDIKNGDMEEEHVFSEKTFLTYKDSESQLGFCKQSSQSSISTNNSDGQVPQEQEGGDGSGSSSYAKIDYFLKHKLKGKPSVSQEDISSDDDFRVHSLSSDQELDNDKSSELSPKMTDYTSEVDSGVYSSSGDLSFLQSSNIAGDQLHEMVQETERAEENIKAEAERMAMHKCIINNIIESESIYVDCLRTLHQYMKALKSNITTSQPLLSLEDLNTIFYKIPDLHDIHFQFLEKLKGHVNNPNSQTSVCEAFKLLASKLEVYSAFLQNYSKAIETVRKCSLENSTFSEITRIIKLNSLKGQTVTLEDLLHKPVARIQKNALVLHDLLRYTSESHPDHLPLKNALKMSQCFLSDLNLSSPESMFPTQDRAQRHLVKNSFIIELSEGHRKLRHLFLFNDVIVCAKYKPSTRQKFTFEVKWYIPLTEVLLFDPEDAEEVKESTSVDIVTLKTRASAVRDQILKEERIIQGKEKAKGTGRSLDKQRKKLSEVEAQLVLASPNLVFRVGHKNNKTYTFFLSSEFDRSQWIEAISVLQASASATTPSLCLYELQTWIASCRKYLETNLGSFLLRSDKDDDLLAGDLHVAVQKFHGPVYSTEVFFSIEVDSYGHFFKKADTEKMRNNMEPHLNQEFVIELEGSQTLRILCYEEHPSQGTIIRGKAAIELSQSWLMDKYQEKSVSLHEYMLTLRIKFVPSEIALRQIPSSKNAGMFGAKLEQVCKNEGSNIPFIISSCVREVEKRGMKEVGIYRVSGSTSDVQRLKKAFETNLYEAEQLLKEVDIHTVTGLLKLYLRELPEAPFTDNLYRMFFEAFSLQDKEARKRGLLSLFQSLPEINREVILKLINHMVKVNQHENNNKMSLHNLATVFGPNILRPAQNTSGAKSVDLLTASTVDVMAQAGILYFFLKRRAAGLPLTVESSK
ncbi:active breakpoint cluster region-related protein-like [Tachypleus tridentatus]|uniref:active breakpoint cluster region-related protein-like n=1 Tax=Tachypleus tridentatus TaxID=6853 RepID=UPI003FD082B3